MTGPNIDDPIVSIDPTMIQPPPGPDHPIGPTLVVERPPLNISKLRHPTEPLRFALAIVSAALVSGLGLFVLAALGHITQIVLIVGGIILAFGLVWATIQIWRIRLLGDAVLVSAHTLPQVQEVVDVVRARLSYTRRVDVFVVDKVSRVLAAGGPPIAITSFFGTHVMVVEGDVLGDLTVEAERQQLVFLLATYVGALKMRYQQWWSPILVALQLTGLPVAALWFIYPWYRATVYSGDRIAYVCCGDLDVSLQAVYRSMVGRSVAAYLRADGLTSQALMARRRPVLRLAQLLRPTPHATNRYLELLAFMRVFDRPAFNDRRTVVGATDREVKLVLVRLARRPARPFAPAIGIVLAIVALIGALVGGLALGHSSQTDPIAAVKSLLPNSPDTPAPVTMSQESQLVQQLKSYAPAAMQPCTDESTSAGADGALALVMCGSNGSPSSPSYLWFFAFSSKATMRAAIHALGGSPPSTGDCNKGEPARQTWGPSDTSTTGPLECYVDKGTPSIAWGSDSTWTLAVASDPSWSLKKLSNWWTHHAPAFS